VTKPRNYNEFSGPKFTL